MSVVISILIVVCCIVLVLAVLIQNPKGGGFASGFQSSAQVMGVRRAADFLEKTTWSAIIVLFVLSIWAAKGGTDAPEAQQGSATKDRAAEYDTKAGKPGANPGGITLPGQPAPQPGANQGQTPPAGNP
jgi:preprotein translocase subunit SecG